MMAVDTTLTERARRRWDARSRGYDLVARVEGWLGGSRLRRRMWSLVGTGRVLEVGVGTGANLRHHPKGAQVTGIDLSTGMLSRARDKAARQGRDILLLEMDAQALSFPGSSFDTVAATYVFCSVPEPVTGLKQTREVLKPGGRLVLLEHVRLPGPLGRIMDWLNPLAIRFMGSDINRNTVANVRKAGFEVEAVHSYMGGLVKLIVARPGPGMPGANS
jgi:ubiquinone/menaquinone biosynthesis C-methylase UbiE